jgi:hypothetical protein
MGNWKGWLHSSIRTFVGLLVGVGLTLSAGQDLLKTWEPKDFLEGQEPVVRMVPSGDGRVIAIQSRSGSIRVYDLERRETLRLLLWGGEPIVNLALSRSGDQVAVVTAREVQVAETRGDTPFRRILQAKERLAQAAILSEKNLLAVAGDEGLRVIQFTTGEVLFSRKEPPCLVVEFSPDGRFLAVAQGKEVVLYDLPNLVEHWKVSQNFYPTALAFSAGARHLAVAGDSNTLALLEPATGKVLARPSLGFTASRVQHLALAPDGDALVVASDRRLVILEKLLSGKGEKKDLKLDGPITSLVLSGPSQSLFATEQGRRSLWAWGTNLQLPQAPPLEAVLVRPAPAGITPPKIAILSPANESNLSGDMVNLRVKVTYASSHPLSGIRVMVDGALIQTSGMRGVRPRSDAEPPRGTSAASATGTPDAAAGSSIALPPGMVEEVQELVFPSTRKDCTIAVLAETALATSDLATVKLRWAGTRRFDPDTLPKLYVLAVGVSNYQNEELKLAYPAKDASDFVAMAKKQKGRLFKDVVVQTLTDQKATRDNVMDGLEWLQKQVTQKDVAFAFFAGHGINDPITGQFYFLPYNADTNAIKRTMVANTDVTSTLDSLPGKRVLFLDSCHSANVTGKGRARAALDLAQVRKEMESAGNGTLVFAAASGRQGALENPTWGNGAFTKAVLEAMAGKADTKATGRVTVSMLNSYIAERVKELTGGNQTPIFKNQDDLGDFPLALLHDVPVDPTPEKK